MSKRTYDPTLIDAIEEGARTVDAGEAHGPAGLPLELRPCPDEPREHALDPRVWKMCLDRMSGAVITPSFADVCTFRSKPPKENYPLDSGAVTEEAILMDFSNRRIPAHVFAPEGPAAERPCLIYYHGGGFTTGSIAQLRNVCRYIAELADAVVIHPDYRLAPEAPFPAAVDDCVDAFDWVVAHAAELGVDASRIAIGGDSAGGSLSNAVVQRTAGDAHLRLVILIYALVDGGPVPADWSYELYPVIPEHEQGARMRVDRIKDANDDLVDMVCMGNSAQLRDPLISAAYATNLELWPRTVSIASEYDYLRHQDEQFALALAQAGVSVRAIRYLGCDHGFLEQLGVMPQVEDMCRIIADEIRAMPVRRKVF